MIHFIRLTRPINLLIVAITMYGLGWFFDGFLFPGESGIQSLDFFLLVFSTTIIAAAGNIINDYFDVRADRINKPERLIIGKHIKRRVAIVTHWGLNVVAFSIAAYLSWRLDTLWYLFIHLLSINILWYYSSYFKRKFLIGNILIAALTAMVPILVGFYYHHSLQLGHFHDARGGLNSFPLHSHFLFISILIALFAFVLNLAREIVKDMEDVEGDQLLRARTVPIVMGTTSSKWMITFVLLISLVSGFTIIFLEASGGIVRWIPLYLSQLLVFFALFQLYRAKEKAHYKLINTWIKLSMVFGLILPVYWKILLMYGW